MPGQSTLLVNGKEGFPSVDFEEVEKESEKGQEKIGNEGGGAGVVFGEALSEEKLDDGEGGEKHADQAEVQIVGQEQGEYADGREKARAQFGNRDDGHQDGNRALEGRILEMVRVIVFFPLPIEDLVESGLDEKNGGHDGENDLRDGDFSEALVE